MKHKAIATIMMVTLLAGTGLYFRLNSSYDQYQNAQNNSNVSEEKETYVKTPEDVAIDKKLKEKRKYKEQLSREQGIAVTTQDDPEIIGSTSWKESDYADMEKSIMAFLKKQTDKYKIDKQLYKLFGQDPRINKMILENLDRKPLKGYTVENLQTFEVKQKSGDYSTIILGRTADGVWKVLAEGNYYELREEILGR